MKYILAIGVLVKPYKCPKLRIFLDDRLLDDLHFNENILEKTVPRTTDYFSHGKPLDQNKKNLSIPERFFLYHIDEDVLSNGSSLKIDFYDCKSNYNNGFISRSDEYHLKCIFLAPQKYFFKNKDHFDAEFGLMLKENNFIHDENSEFANKKDSKYTKSGWPCPSVSVDDNLPFKDMVRRGENYTATYLIRKKFGIYQFEEDFDQVLLEHKETHSTAWNEIIKKYKENNVKVWPINSFFLSFSYVCRNNKYLHEDK